MRCPTIAKKAFFPSPPNRSALRLVQRGAPRRRPRDFSSALRTSISSLSVAIRSSMRHVRGIASHGSSPASAAAEMRVVIGRRRLDGSFGRRWRLLLLLPGRDHRPPRERLVGIQCGKAPCEHRLLPRRPSPAPRERRAPSPSAPMHNHGSRDGRDGSEVRKSWRKREAKQPIRFYTSSVPLYIGSPIALRPHA